MRAVVFAGPGRVSVEDVPAPRIGAPDEAIVDVELTAICGSDLHLLDGKTPGMRRGSVIGHEFVGRLADAGEAVAGFEPGQRVLGSFLIACGRCGNCSKGRYNFCSERRALGLGTLTGDLDGAQAGSVKVPNASLNLKSAEGVPPQAAVFAGDVMATGFYGAELASPGPDELVLVLGAGPVGLFTAMALDARGARTAIADLDSKRASFAGELLGPARSIHLQQDLEPADQVAQAAGGPADVVVEAVGSVPALKTSMRVVRDGGRVVVLGVYGAERYDLPLGMAWVRGLDISFAGMANVHAHWDEALAAVAEGRLDPSRVISHRLPLDDAEEGYELFRSKEATKVVLEP